MRYRQLILLTGLYGNDWDETKSLPDEVDIVANWKLVKLNEDLKNSFNYFEKTVAPVQMPYLLATQYALSKEIDIPGNDLNAYNQVNEVKELPFESFWITIALRLIRPSAFVPHRILLRKDKLKWTPVQANAIRDHYVTPRGFSHLDEIYENSDVNKIQAYSKYLLVLASRYENKHHCVLKALDFFHETFRQYRYETSFLLLVIALESLYSYNNNNVAEQVAMGSAFFLEANAANRLDLYQQIKAVYDIRSKLVHGSRQKTNFYQDINLQKNTYLQAYKAVQVSLTQIIERDEEALFNAKDVLENWALKNRLGIV